MAIDPEYQRILNQLLCVSFALEEHKGELVEKRKLLGTSKNVRIEMYPMDHNPPHFHVIIDNERSNKVTVSVNSGEILSGEDFLNKLDKKRILHFYLENKKLIKKSWDEMTGRQ